MPTLSKVIRIRDVVFMRLGQLGRKNYSNNRTLRQLVTMLDIKDLPKLDKEIEQALCLLTQPAIKEIKEDKEAKNQLISKL
jgi:hypothetical protein